MLFQIGSYLGFMKKTTAKLNTYSHLLSTNYRCIQDLNVKHKTERNLQKKKVNRIYKGN